MSAPDDITLFDRAVTFLLGFVCYGSAIYSIGVVAWCTFTGIWFEITGALP